MADNVYLLNIAAGTISESSAPAVSVGPIDANCKITISNFVKEVIYRVFYEDADKEYLVKKITADFIIGDELVLQFDLDSSGSCVEPSTYALT